MNPIVKKIRVAEINQMVEDLKGAMDATMEKIIACSGGFQNQNQEKVYSGIQHSLETAYCDVLNWQGDLEEHQK